jgi:glutamate-1-semialdehyde 2,1-aminomutase
MAVYDACRSGSISHGGTFNGNPVAAAAGLATLRELTPATFERLDVLGDRLRAGIAASIERDATDARVEVVGSLFQVWSGGSVAAFATGVGAVPGLFVGLLLEGFYVAPRGMGAIPAIATTEDVDHLAAAIGRVLVALRRAPEMAPA